MVNSNWRNERNFTDFLKQGETVAIADIDTRRLTRLLRDKGAQSGAIIAGEGISEEAALEAARQFGGRARGLDELKQAVDAAFASRKPTLINAVIDPAAGKESGNIGNLNPSSVVAQERYPQAKKIK